MAMDNSQSNEERQWATDDAYMDQAYDTKDVNLPSTGMWFRVREIPPMKFTQLLEDEGLRDIADSIDEETTFDEVQSGNTDALDSDEKDSIAAFVRFFRETVVPAIIRPKNAHWNDPPNDPDAPEVFDVSNLDGEDMEALMSSIGKMDRSEQTNETGDYVGKFQ